MPSPCRFPHAQNPARPPPAKRAHSYQIRLPGPPRSEISAQMLQPDGTAQRAIGATFRVLFGAETIAPKTPSRLLHVRARFQNLAETGWDALIFRRENPLRPNPETQFLKRKNRRFFSRKIPILALPIRLNPKDKLNKIFKKVFSWFDSRVSDPFSCERPTSSAIWQTPQHLSIGASSDSAKITTGG